MPNGRYHRKTRQVKYRPINLREVGLQFDSGLVIGRWRIPDPNNEPQAFSEIASDIGWHIALQISRGATGAFFVDMDKNVQEVSHVGDDDSKR